MTELQRWADRAAPLWERADISVNDRQLARWVEVLGSRDLLDRRLRSTSRSAPRSVEWMPALQTILNRDAPHTDPDEAFATAEINQVPFGQALTPFIRYARRRLAARAGLARSVFSPAARTSLEGELLEHLGLISSLALGRVFYDFRFARAPMAAFEDVWTKGEPSTSIYRAFVMHLLRGGWSDVFERYPVLARLMTCSTLQWIENTALLCERIADDMPRLRKRFRTLELPVNSVTAGLSDRHHDGQSVARLTFANGERLIYKPRSVKPEIFFNTVLQWMNRHGLPLSLETVRCLDRSRYGWMEFVSHRDCTTTDEASRFYQRAGALLAALHACGVSDVHYENLIASGEHPIVVDLETLLAGRRSSVLDTGFLPAPPRAKEHQADASALGAGDVQDSGLRFPVWHHVNTDQMTLTDGAPQETEQHRVRLNGELVNASSHVRELKAGFRDGYACLMKHRRALLAEPFLSNIDRLELRLLLRDSATYGQMHLHLLYPEHLEDGIDRSIEIEWLARPLCIRALPSAGRGAVYAHERDAMERLDLPLFTTKTWRAMRHDPSTQEAQAFGAPRDSKALRARLTRLSEQDCRRQLAAITRALSPVPSVRR